MPLTEKTRLTYTSRFGRSVAIGLLAAAYGGGLLGADAASGAKANPYTYATCMRAHGIKDFPYPKKGGGAIRITSKPGSDLNPNNPRFKAAQKACKAYMPAGGHVQTGSSSGGPSTTSSGGGPVTTKG